MCTRFKHALLDGAERADGIVGGGEAQSICMSTVRTALEVAHGVAAMRDRNGFCVWAQIALSIV